LADAISTVRLNNDAHTKTCCQDLSSLKNLPASAFCLTAAF